MNETELERLIVRLQGDSTSYQKMVKDAQKSTQDLGDKLGDNTGRLAVMSQRVNAFGLQLRGYGLQMAAVGAGVVGIGGLMKSAFDGIQIAARNESTEIAFKSLIGNAEQAKATLADLRKFAVETPFEQPEILGAAKLMLGFGTAAEDLVPTMRMLGDVSSGLEINLGELARVFGTLKSQGRAFTADINQFALRGIPIWEQLELQLGKTNEEVREMVKDGKISFKEIEQAFKATEGPMSRFTGVMKDQSESVMGLFSTMRDNINIALGDVGKTLTEQLGLKELMKTIGDSAGQIASAFQSISPGVKQFLVSLLAGGAAAAALVAAIVAIKVGIAAIVSLVAALGPFGIAMVAVFAAVSVGVALLVNELGGVGATIELVKKKAIEAWEWLAPVRKAIGDLAETVQGLLSQAWEEVKRVGMEAWQSLFGDVDVNWDKIRKSAVLAIQFIEFTLLNFGTVAGAFWKKLQYDAVRVFNMIVHLVTKVLPAAVEHAVKIIPAYWQRLFDFIKDMALSRFDLVVKTFQDMQKVLSGQMSGEDFLGNLALRVEEESKRTFEALSKLGKEALVDIMEFKVPERTEGPLERLFREDAERAMGGVQEEFRKFIFNRQVRDAFRQAFSPQPGEATPPAVKALDKVKAAAWEAKKGVDALDHALTGSSESQKRLDAHIRSVGRQFNLRPRSGVGGTSKADQLLEQISASTRSLADNVVAIAEANF